MNASRTTRPLRSRRPASARRAFTMVEVLVGMMVVASASVLLSASLSSSSSQIESSRELASAAAVASGQIDHFLGVPLRGDLGASSTFSVPTMWDMKPVDVGTFLTNDNATPLEPVMDIISDDVKDGFLFGKEVVVHGGSLKVPIPTDLAGAESHHEAIKIQVDIYEKEDPDDASGPDNRGRLIYSAGQLGWRQDTR